MDSLTDIAVFVQVIDSGSFTAAADRLELSKSVVSKYVTRLEDQLGLLRRRHPGGRLHRQRRNGAADVDRGQDPPQDRARRQLRVSRMSPAHGTPAAAHLPRVFTGESTASFYDRNLLAAMMKYGLGALEDPDWARWRID